MLDITSTILLYNHIKLDDYEKDMPSSIPFNRTMRTSVSFHLLSKEFNHYVIWHKEQSKLVQFEMVMQHLHLS